MRGDDSGQPGVFSYVSARGAGFPWIIRFGRFRRWWIAL